MTHIYANLLGNWTDITKNGTVDRGNDPATYFKENLSYVDDDGKELDVPRCFKGGYIFVEYGDKSYRLSPSDIQIVDE